MNEPNWITDLKRCPSQCYCSFWSEGIHYCIYLRWRHEDPWTAEVVELDAHNNFAEDFDKWVDMDPQFCSHDNVGSLQSWCVQFVKTTYNDVRFDEETEIYED